MKKVLLLTLLVLPLILSGCFFDKKVEDMAALDEKGNYNYKNSEFKFEISLPADFQYYQVQRINANGYSDIEYFVPTSDIDYPQQVLSYAKAIIIRVSDKETWEKNKEFEKIGETEDKVYEIFFWDRVPKEWASKWNGDMKDKIKKTFKIEK